MSKSLDNTRVLVTRPREQSEELQALIEEAGGKALSLPLLAIEASADAESKQRCQFISGYDWVIFISQNAVRHALSLLPSNNWTDSTAVAAVGRTTTNALRQVGLPVDVHPDDSMNSEGLLEALADESLSGKKILIIRGVGGREALAEGLREKKALVDYAEVYRRVCPDINSQQLAQLIDEGIDVISIASGETCQNLASIIKTAAITDTQKQQLRSRPLIVVSERIKTLAEQLGFSAKIVVANEPDNKGLLKAIQQWHSTSIGGDNE